MSKLEKILNESEDLKSSNKFREAINLLENAYKANKNSNHLKKALVDLLFEFGGHLNDDLTAKYQKAILIFKKITKIESNNYRAYYNLGISFQNLNQLDDALEAFQTAINIKPDYYFCYYNIGLVMEEKKDLKQAIEYHKKALKISPNFRYAKQAISELRDIIDKSSKLHDFKQLKSLFLISDKIRIDLIQEILKISKTELISILIKWGEKYNFKLDGDYLIINKSTLKNLFNDLENNGEN